MTGRGSATDVRLSPVLPRVARGDSAAVSECISRYGGLVQAIARRYPGYPGEIDDAVQEVFIELWKQAGRFDPAVASELAFVAMIARRRLIDLFRRRKARPATEIMPEFLAEPEFEIGGAAQTEDELVRIRSILTRLPDEQRAVLLASIADGLSHSEVAEQFGLPLGTVKTYIRRGLLFVRERLPRFGPEGDS